MPDEFLKLVIQCVQEFLSIFCNLLFKNGLLGLTVTGLISKLDGSAVELEH